MSDGHQRQRHGVKKKLVEGIGGLLTGAALVVLLRELVKRRATASPTTVLLSPTTQPTSGDSA